MSSEEGFHEGLTVHDVVPNPEDKYDALEGTERLRSLEAALGSARGGWNDDPAERADDWLRQQGKAYRRRVGAATNSPSFYRGRINSSTRPSIPRKRRLVG
jgi:hypothetical protein